MGTLPSVMDLRLPILWLLLAAELSVGLRNVRVTVPTAVRRGDSAHLYCEYELEDNERLYSIKWYKGKREFFRYTPQVHPSVQVFSTVSGIDVERSLSNESQVVMRAVETNYSGKYSCEVSADAPSFHTIIVSGDMEVVDPPIEQPSVTGLQARYRPGDILRANCTSHNSKPAANLTWTINDVPIPPQYVKLYRPIKDSYTGLETSILGVNVMVAHDHFVQGKLKLKCAASIHQIYHEVIEQFIPEDRPRILATGVSASGHSINLYQGSVHESELTDQSDAYLTVNGYKADKSSPLSSSSGSLQIDSYVKVCWVTFYICIICTVMVYSIRYLMVT
uniref:Ig-like domain-containing protein n=1 Tax=Anopheles atroparvus TaxID=41427 RepID=A0AAG5DF80_ANOAO